MVFNSRVVLVFMLRLLKISGSSIIHLFRKGMKHVVLWSAIVCVLAINENEIDIDTLSGKVAIFNFEKLQKIVTEDVPKWIFEKVLFVHKGNYCTTRLLYFSHNCCA